MILLGGALLIRTPGVCRGSFADGSQVRAMQEEDSNRELLRRLREGDPQAEQELFARYARVLTRLAEQHLSRKVAAREDGEDVVQSAFRTFFRRSGAGEFR